MKKANTAIRKELGQQINAAVTPNANIPAPASTLKFIDLFPSTDAYILGVQAFYGARSDEPDHGNLDSSLNLFAGAPRPCHGL